MPTKKLKVKSSKSKVKAKKKPVAKKRASVKKKAPLKKMSIVHEVTAPVHQVSSNICRSCNALPVGAVELVSLLLVLTVSLSAVLLTSVYALEHQAQEIELLQTQLNI